MFTPHLYSHELLRTLVAIVDSGSFAKASERLHCTQAAVSLQVRRLEEAAEQGLFDKRGRQMVLNAAGHVLVAYARQILALNAEATLALHGRNVDGLLRLGAPQDVAEDHLPEILRKIAAAYPRMRLEVRVERNQQLILGIARGDYDVAVALTSEARQWTLAQPGQVTQLGQPRMQWIAADSFLAKPPHGPLPLVLLEHPCVFRTQAIAALDAANVPYRLAYSTTSLSGLRAAVEAGLGVTARLVARDDEARGIRPLRAKHAGVRLPKLSSLRTLLYQAQDASVPAIALAAELLALRLRADANR